MRITILCSDEFHPVYPYLKYWKKRHEDKHDISLAKHKAELGGGDILFLVSCSELIDAAERQAFKSCLVLHASDLPRGRGWSPHVWDIVNGAEQITVTLLEAADKIDSGRIWKKITIPIPKHALWNEVNESLFSAEISLISFGVESFGKIEPQVQSSKIEPTYFRRRFPVDSEISPFLSISEQFNKIRVCDPERYPAYFVLHGCRYKLILEKMNE